jgi:CRISPR/Cas system-associated endoribonuclease Cas2
METMVAIMEAMMTVIGKMGKKRAERNRHLAKMRKHYSMRRQYSSIIS